MSNIKERLIGAITVMSDDEARNLWKIIENHHAPTSWDEIEEVIPDDIDIQMLHEAKNDPECQKFVPPEEAARMLNNNMTTN